MARTRSSVAAKVSVGKSSKVRCSPAPAPSSGTTAGPSGVDRSSRSSLGGNPVCPRETPKWQKPITGFLKQNQTTRADDENIAEAGSSNLKRKRNIIHSDDEEENTSEKPDTQTNYQSDTQTDEQIHKELDEIIELGPLIGEDSHKIDEYYSTKNKGKGKKSHKYKKVDNGNIGGDTDKENVDKDGVTTNNTKNIDEGYINGQDIHDDKENINMNNKDAEEIDKNDLVKENNKSDLDNEKVDKDVQIEVLDNEDTVKGNIDKEDVNSEIGNKEEINTNNLDKENKVIEKEHDTDSEINKNDLDIEKIDYKENGNSNSVRNKRNLDELKAEDERDCKKIKVD